MMNAMEKEQFEELCAAYVLGALPADERRKFVPGLAGMDQERIRIYEEFLETALHLPLAAEARPAPVAVRERILGSVRRSEARRAADPLERFANLLGFGHPRFAFAVAVGLVLLVAALGYYTHLLQGELGEARGSLAVAEFNLSVERARLTALKTSMEEKEAVLQVLQSPKIEIVLLNGQEVNPGGFGKLIYDPVKRSAILQISHLPALPKDKDYQLWVIRDKKPVSAGVFSLDETKTESVFRINDLVEADKKSINAFAITLEPKGGVAQPTGKIYLLGTPTL